MNNMFRNDRIIRSVSVYKEVTVYLNQLLQMVVHPKYIIVTTIMVVINMNFAKGSWAVPVLTN